MNTTHLLYKKEIEAFCFQAFYIILIVACSFGFTTDAIAADSVSKETNTILAVNSAFPESIEWDVSIPATGWFAPWHEAIIASEIDGMKISEVNADVGDVVHKGQALALLEQETVLAEIHRLEASVSAAEAGYTLARSNADRSRQINGTGAQAKQQYEESISAEKSASAALAMAQAMLVSQRIRLKQTKIVAVDDGIISSRTASLGNVVTTGAELFRLIRQQRVEWQAEIASHYMPLIRKGQHVLINTPNGDILKGRVRVVAPEAGKNTSRAIVYVILDNSATPKPGVYASGSIVLSTKSALAVPESAIVLSDGLSYVFTMQPDNHVSRVRVETGRRQDGKVEILKGLDSKDKFVKSGGAFLSDGAIVTVLDQTKEGV